MNQFNGFCSAICFSLFLLITLSSTHAQQSSKPVTKFYGTGAVGGATRNGDLWQVGLQGVIKNKFSASITYQSMEARPKNLPSDYTPETGVALFFPYRTFPKVQLNSFSVTAGKYFQAGRNTWLTTEAGISFMQGEKAGFQKQAVTSSNLLGLFASTSSNYKSDIESKNSVGAVIKCDFNWAFTAATGFGFGVFANINGVQSPVGFNASFSMGLMGRVKKSHSKKQKSDNSSLLKN